MTATNRGDAERLIVQLLDEHGEPTRTDWKRLIDAYPEHVRYFLEAALIRDVGASVHEDEEVEVDAAAQTKTLSYALNKVHQVGAPAFVAAQAAIDAIKNPLERRSLANRLGIGSEHVVLVNGVLAGRTKAPPKVLRLLAEVFDVEMMALKEVCARTFLATAVPPYKLPNGKPNIPLEPATWQQAVRQLQVSKEETARLLAFAEEEEQA
jgi:hypothetical protein